MAGFIKYIFLFLDHWQNLSPRSLDRQSGHWCLLGSHVHSTKHHAVWSSIFFWQQLYYHSAWLCVEFGLCCTLRLPDSLSLAQEVAVLASHLQSVGRLPEKQLMPGQNSGAPWWAMGCCCQTDKFYRAHSVRPPLWVSSVAFVSNEDWWRRE